VCGSLRTLAAAWVDDAPGSRGREASDDDDDECRSSMQPARHQGGEKRRRGSSEPCMSLLLSVYVVDVCGVAFRREDVVGVRRMRSRCSHSKTSEKRKIVASLARSVRGTRRQMHLTSSAKRLKKKREAKAQQGQSHFCNTFCVHSSSFWPVAALPLSPSTLPSYPLALLYLHHPVSYLYFLLLRLLLLLVLALLYER
jgi:hypothetical protein